MGRCPEPRSEFFLAGVRLLVGLIVPTRDARDRPFTYAYHTSYISAELVERTYISLSTVALHLTLYRKSRPPDRAGKDASDRTLLDAIKLHTHTSRLSWQGIYSDLGAALQSRCRGAYNSKQDH